MTCLSCTRRSNVRSVHTRSGAAAISTATTAFMAGHLDVSIGPPWDGLRKSVSRLPEKTGLQGQSRGHTIVLCSGSVTCDRTISTSMSKNPRKVVMLTVVDLPELVGDQGLVDRELVAERGEELDLVVEPRGARRWRRCASCPRTDAPARGRANLVRGRPQPLPGRPPPASIGSPPPTPRPSLRRVGGGDVRLLNHGSVLDRSGREVRPLR